MIAINTTATSTHAHARPKTRVGVFGQRGAPRVRARAPASREARWGNSCEVRPGTSGLSQYLSPEPMLQKPSWVRGQARRGFSAPTYAYARNNPIRYVDPDGNTAIPWPWTWTWPTLGPPSPWTFMLPALIPGQAGNDPAERPDHFPGGRPRPAQPVYPSPTWPSSPSIPDFCAMGGAAAGAVGVKCTYVAFIAGLGCHVICNGKNRIYESPNIGGGGDGPMCPDDIYEGQTQPYDP